MAIISCPDCKKEMSDSAPACPNCGRPNNCSTHVERSVGILLGAGILLFPLLFAWFTLRGGYSATARVVSFSWLLISILLISSQNDSSKNTVNELPSISESVQSVPALQVDIRTLLADYKNNEVAADNKYKGNSIIVSGTVDDIKKDIMNSLYVTIGTGGQFEIPVLQAFFDDSMNNQLSSLRKGQSLKVQCRIDGLLMNVLGKDCVIK